MKPIGSADAARIVKACHYSGKVVQNSQLHFGVFLNGKCGGAMQFGPSLDKRKMLGIVERTKWNGFLELNRMAFADWLPRNSESRAIAVAMRLIRKSYPHIEWVVSFADGTQCGDGTIYRASGFVLTGIAVNGGLYKMPNGETCSVVTFADGAKGGGKTKRRHGYREGEGATRFMRRVGAKKATGFQLRYIYFLNPRARQRLTVPILPFSEIERRGAGMYLGKPKRARSTESSAPAIHAGEGGSIPTRALQFTE